MATPERPDPTAPPPKNDSFVQDEMDSAKYTLPPWGVVGVVLLAIFVVIGTAAYLMRPKPKATGTIDEVFAVPMANNNVMATVKVTINNVGTKPLWIQEMKVTLKTDQGEHPDTAASAVDFPRYLEAFPDLRAHTIEPLKVEDRIVPGAQEQGSVMASFPVTLDQFNARKSISVTIQPYDQAPVTITK